MSSIIVYMHDFSINNRKLSHSIHTVYKWRHKQKQINRKIFEFLNISNFKHSEKVQSKLKEFD